MDNLKLFADMLVLGLAFWAAIYGSLHILMPGRFRFPIPARYLAWFETNTETTSANLSTKQTSKFVVISSLLATTYGAGAVMDSVSYVAFEMEFVVDYIASPVVFANWTRLPPQKYTQVLDRTCVRRMTGQDRRWCDDDSGCYPSVQLTHVAIVRGTYDLACANTHDHVASRDSSEDRVCDQCAFFERALTLAADGVCEYPDDCVYFNRWLGWRSKSDGAGAEGGGDDRIRTKYRISRGFVLLAFCIALSATVRMVCAVVARRRKGGPTGWWQGLAAACTTCYPLTSALMAVMPVSGFSGWVRLCASFVSLLAYGTIAVACLAKRARFSDERAPRALLVALAGGLVAYVSLVESEVEYHNKNWGNIFERQYELGSAAGRSAP